MIAEETVECEEFDDADDAEEVDLVARLLLVLVTTTLPFEPVTSLVIGTLTGGFLILPFFAKSFVPFVLNLIGSKLSTLRKCAEITLTHDTYVHTGLQCVCSQSPIGVNRFEST